MLFASIPFQGSLIGIYFAGMIAATLLELVVGLAMESIFKVKYWDYSNQKIQYKGVICLSSSIAWGFLTIFLTKVLHKPIEKIIFAIPQGWEIVLVSLLSVIFIADTVVSVRAALDMRKMLENMAQMKAELEELEAQVAAQLAERRELLRQKTKEQKQIIIQSASLKKEKLLEHMEDYAEGYFTSELRKSETYEKLKEKIREYQEYNKKFGIRKEKLLKAHPSATSAKYKEVFHEAIKELEEDLERRKQKIKEKLKRKKET